MTGCAYHGPVLVPTPQEVARIRDALTGHLDPIARAVIRKCDAALNANHHSHTTTTRSTP